MEKSEPVSTRAWSVLIMGVPPLEAGLCRILSGAGRTDALRSMLWTVLFCGAAVFYLARFREWLGRRPYYRQIVFVCMVFGQLCALFYGRFRPAAAFYLGAVLTAALVELGLGMILAAGFWAAAVLNGAESMEEAVSLLMLGLALCLMAAFLREGRNLLTVLVLGGLVTALLYFLQTSWPGVTVSYRDLGLALFSTAALQLCAALWIRIYLLVLRRKRGNL